MRTFIRQPGNKSKHIRYIEPHLPKEYKSYYEPFVGSGALFFHLQPKKWVINDINDDLMNLYRAIRNDVASMIKSLKTFDKRYNFSIISNDEKIAIMKEYMKKIADMPFDNKRALYYIILKQTAYMGSILVKGVFKFKGLDINIMKGYKPYFLTERYFENLRNVSKVLNSNGEIYTLDYKQILSKTRKNDFCFIDSPYDEEHEYNFTYNVGSRNKIDFVEELLAQVKKLDKKGVKWLMTQADTVAVRRTFKEYNVVEFPVYRPFNKAFKNELIIKNY
jgi:DNA adenine methylase